MSTSPPDREPGQPHRLLGPGQRVRYIPCGRGCPCDLPTELDPRVAAMLARPVIDRMA